MLSFWDHLVRRRYQINLKWFFLRLMQPFRRIRVYALVGKSGTGKSFRAQLIAQKHGIELIIDDGLLIRGQRILGGKSSKKEKRGFSAVKVALFFDRQQVREVKSILKREQFKRILIIGTSERMVRTIAGNLALPFPRRMIKIEEIATEMEIEAASRSRQLSGKHVIPVPAIEVKRNYPHIFLHSIQVFFQRSFFFRKGKKGFEKTVVRTEYTKKGKVAISKEALSQMVMHCVNEHSPAFRISKIIIQTDKGGYKLEVVLRVPFEVKIAGKVHELQRYILENIEQYAGLDLQELNVTVGSIDKQARITSEEAERQIRIAFPEER